MASRPKMEKKEIKLKLNKINETAHSVIARKCRNVVMLLTKIRQIGETGKCACRVNSEHLIFTGNYD